MNNEQQVTRNKNEAEWQLLHYKLQFYKLVASVKKDDYVVISDDADGVITAIKFIDYIKKVKGFELKIGGFFRIGTNKSTISFITNEPIPDDNLICCDVALEHGFTSDKPIRCIDNHVCKLVDDDYFNPLSVNFNDNVSAQDYTLKSATSSLLTLLTLCGHEIMYDDDKDYYTQEQQEVLLCVDSTFCATTSDYKGYTTTWKYVWGINKHFADVSHLKQYEFRKKQSKYHLKHGEIDDKMHVSKKGKLVIVDLLHDICADYFDNLDLSYLNNLQFKSYIEYKRFTDTDIKGKSKSDIIKKHGDILNIAVTKSYKLEGCVVDSDSILKHYQTN